MKTLQSDDEGVRPCDEGPNLSKAVLELVLYEACMTPGDVARLLDVDKSFISLVRGGKRNLKVQDLYKLSVAAKIPFQLLIAKALPIDPAKVPPDLRTAQREYERSLKRSLDFLIDFHEANNAGGS